jgi:uncharacterized protein
VIKVVVDTNTLVSAALNKDSISGKAFTKATRISEILASLETLEELNDVLFRSKFDKYVSLEARKYFYTDYLSLVTILPVKVKILDCRDSKDNKYLELAVTAHADVIITGDEDLLILHPYQGIPILRSSAFLAWVENNI